MTSDADGAIGGLDKSNTSAEEQAEQPESVGGEHDKPVVGAGHRRRVTGVGFTFLAAVILVAAATTGWFGYRTLQSSTVHDRSQQFLDAGKTMAANLTTIDSASVDDDMRQVLEMSTGDFRAQFEKSAAAFADVVRNAQAKSVGTVTAAGIESVDGNSAQILVTTSVQTTNAGTAEPQSRLWRMRVTIEKQGDVPMVSKVDFVP